MGKRCLMILKNISLTCDLGTVYVLVCVLALFNYVVALTISQSPSS